jgi:hypothetical protein
MFRSEVGDYFKSIGFEGNVFEPSALKSSYLRGAKSAQKISVSNTIMESVKRLSKTEKGLQLTGENINDWVPVNTLMDKVGLKYLPEEFAGKYLQKDVFKALNEMYSVSSSEEVMSGLWKAFTDTQRFMKSAYTVFFPAYHGRNAISNFFLNWIAGVKNPKSYYQSFQLQKAAIATHKIMRDTGVDFATAASKVNWPAIAGKSGQALWDLADQYGIVGRALGTMDVAEVAGEAAGKLLRPAQKGIKGTLAKGLYGQDPVSSAGRAVGRTIEDNARLAHFVEKLSTGLSPMDAARSVKEVLFDYGSLSAFEKKYFRDRMFFFYTFARKNIELQTKTLMQQPAKHAFFAHLAGGTPRLQGEGKYMSDYEQEILNIPTPFRNKEGQPYQIRGLGSPMEEAFGPLGAPGVGIGNRISRLASRAASRLSPLINTPYELAFQKNLFFNTPITSYPEWVVQKTPVGRAYWTGKQIAGGYQKSKMPSTLLNLATGVSVRPVDVEKMKQYKLREVARKVLERNRKTRSFTRYYAPDKENLPERLQAVLQMQR